MSGNLKPEIYLDPEARSMEVGREGDNPTVDNCGKPVPHVLVGGLSPPHNPCWVKKS